MTHPFLSCFVREDTLTSPGNSLPLKNQNQLVKIYTLKPFISEGSVMTISSILDNSIKVPEADWCYLHSFLRKKPIITIPKDSMNTILQRLPSKPLLFNCHHKNACYHLWAHHCRHSHLQYTAPSPHAIRYMFPKWMISTNVIKYTLIFK